MNIRKNILPALLVSSMALASCSSVPTALVSVVPPEKLVDENTLDRSREDGFITDAFNEAYSDFTSRTAAKVLTAKEGNVCYSPLSLWYALALASEGASGETKTEIDSLLTGGREIADTDPANLRLRLAAMLGNYEYTTLDIANSVWSVSGLKESYAKTAAEKYFSECYDVPAFNSDTAKSMSDWVSDKTKGTLKPQFDFDGDLPEMIAILNTVYFKDEWADRFNSSANTEDIFHSPDGDVTATYMHRVLLDNWNTGDGYVTAHLGLKGSTMFFVLPTGEDDIWTILENNDLDTLLNGGERHGGDVTWSLPKFSYDTDLDFTDTLRSLGCEKMFSEDAEFQNMMDVSPLFVSSVKGGTHIAVDEKGVTASAYTEILYCGAMAPTETLDMKLDRPFLWVIKVDGTVIFTGILSNPAA